MTIEDDDMIDGVTIDTNTGSALVTISDHLSWENVHEHMKVLQVKLQGVFKIYSKR